MKKIIDTMDNAIKRLTKKPIENVLFTDIEKYGFKCEAGRLEECTEWVNLKEKLVSDLWCVEKRGTIVKHTNGQGGWMFTVCTNEKEAQSLADSWNEKLGSEAYTITPFVGF